jgi:hypothetical protein
MTDLSPDHLHLLALARAALAARDDKRMWKERPRHACEIHASACDAVWDELERQVQIAAGIVPVLEHPSATMIRRAKQMRGDIVAAALNGIETALERLERDMNNLGDD